MLKQLLYPVILLLSVHALQAQQPFMNEWIDYNKTYYKFKVGPFGFDAIGNPVPKGLVRIPQTALAAIGLGNVPAEHFQLWRDGAEIAVYISTPAGQLSTADYIEFWGEIANGKPDKYLYKDTAYQLTDHTSLETDTAAYYLTVNAGGNNKRFVNAPNASAGTTLEPEKNFMYAATRIFRGYMHYGPGAFVGEKLYLSSYDLGEGLASRSIYNISPMTHTFSNMYADTLGGAMELRMHMAGATPYTRRVKVLLNNDSLTGFEMDYFNTIKFTLPGISPLKIKNNTAAFVIQNNGVQADDDCRIGLLELTYPRLFNFGSAVAFEFFITASPEGRYLKISNFYKGSATPVLYDFTNNKRYNGNAGTGDTIEFLLPPSLQQYHLLLVRNDGSTAQVINTIEQRNFIDYSKIENQGDYLIIANPLLYGSGTENYADQYRAYRSSDSGGGFNVKVVDIHQLEDQFAYGIKMHPLSVMNFLRFARRNFEQPPAYVFLVGKGVTYDAYRSQEANPLTAKLNLVPVFGTPGSDNLLSSDDYTPVPATPIGRLSAVTPAEVGIYLTKVKEYEAAQRDTASTDISGNLWKKKILQLAGANDIVINKMIDSFQLNYTKIISGPIFGGNVKTYSKTLTTGSAYAQAIQEFTVEYNNGAALVEYLGHSSSTSIDFSLDNPANYSNTKKYPFFIVNGCLAGNIFTYDENRLNIKSTISEKFILEPDKGAIGYLSSTNYGVLPYLDIFTKNFYEAITADEYGKGFGNIVQSGLQKALTALGSDFYSRMHAEQITYHGDPAIKMHTYDLPDYAIDSAAMHITPGYINVAMDSFTVNFNIHNLGRGATDSVNLTLFRTYPNGVKEKIFDQKVAPVNSETGFSFQLPIFANRDKGISTITAVADNDNLLSESKENNNAASIKVSISSADLLPVAPYNYAIINTGTVKLIASTAYALDSLTQYVVELDTTSLFNSALKTTRQQTGTGGLVEFDNIPLPLDNNVYFWRVAEDSADKHWNTFSFIYKSGSYAGFEQAHFLQHTNSWYNAITPDSVSRAFNFSKTLNNIFVVHSIFPTSGNEDNQFSMALNGSMITWSASLGHSIIFNVFDPKTLKPVLNTTNPFGSAPPKDCMRRYNFEYSSQSAATRKNAMDFMEAYVQNGYYVVVRKIYDLGDADWAPTIWAKDTALYGHNNSLYHRLKDQGTWIDSFTYPRTFVFIYKKNDTTTYKTTSVLSSGLYDRISLSQNFDTYDSTGTITSPKFGPGKAWHQVNWYGTAENNNHVTLLDILAIDTTGKDSLFYTIGTDQHTVDITTVNAAQYPYVQLRMHTTDGTTIRPYQLKDWRVEFVPVPEGALATNLGSSIPEELIFNHGTDITFDTLKGYVIFKNISNTAMQPLKVNIILYDKANVAHTFTMPYTAALPAGDTVHIPFLLDVRALPEGKYNFYIDINPDNNQPEQYHYNNFLYQYVHIVRDVVLASDGFDLNAKPVNKTVQLTWAVINELNAAGYDVQFGTDGYNFKTIGKVTATDNLALSKQYNFIHSNPVNGSNYYRIKMNGKDGTARYSPVRTAAISLGNVLVYPNPFTNLLNVLLHNNAGIATLCLSDISGREIYRQQFSGLAKLYLPNINAGIYLLQVMDGKTVYTYKVQKL